ncbi:hypothetical protein M6B38_292495 [Iris pallida]|uniref:Uncharacterized protein n=1 Tax=Iris pallida TaxID=29817 RepID=A0AAX6EI57_IRIPA|nr:hypothetical protein M6B38_189150 [Iris pallida]KAJ6844419.1 hypothetical protein M6B38_292495 [Iris pallida]
MDSVIGLKSTDGEVETLSLKGSSSEKVTALECDKLNALVADSEMQVDLSDSVSCTTYCDDKKLSNGRELCPLTPSLESETLETSSASDKTENSEMVSACQTPSESIFDPFAPGPEEMALAPNPKKKTLRGTKMPLRRRLIFDLRSDSEEEMEEIESTLLDKEDTLLESICKSFLELIVSNQAKQISSEYLTKEDNLIEGLKTPTSLPLLTGIADTCPAAPTRPVLKFRRLDQSICRKLEFGSNLI